MEIIRIRKSDKEEIYKLVLEENKALQKYASHSIYDVKFSRKLFERLFKTYFGKNRSFYGIKKDKNIIAIISGYIKPVSGGDIGYIDNLFVSKKYLSQGYATILKDKFFLWLKVKKIRYCQLNVLEKNPAKQIYRKWGFTIDSFHMTKKL